MNKNEIYGYLSEKGIAYEVTEHEAVFSMAELAASALPHPEWDAKNLFLRDDRRNGYFLITVKGDKRVDIKKFRRQHGLRPLSFASPEELWDILGLTPGSVSPFGVLNGGGRGVRVYVDAEFAGGMIGVHPNDNTATVWLRADDLADIIRENGGTVEYTDI